MIIPYSLGLLFTDHTTVLLPVFKMKEFQIS